MINEWTMGHNGRIHLYFHPGELLERNWNMITIQLMYEATMMITHLLTRRKGKIQDIAIFREKFTFSVNEYGSVFFVIFVTYSKTINS